MALARLDRELAATYRQRLAYADEVRANGIKDAQRAWIAERDACGDSVAWLTESYDERLAALRSG